VLAAVVARPEPGPGHTGGRGRRTPAAARQTVVREPAEAPEHAVQGKKATKSIGTSFVSITADNLGDANVSKYVYRSTC